MKDQFTLRRDWLYEVPGYKRQTHVDVAVHAVCRTQVTRGTIRRKSQPGFSGLYYSMKYRIIFIDRATASAPTARAAVRLKFQSSRTWASFASSSLNQNRTCTITASNLR